MPSCVVKMCKNNSTNQSKSQGITFHRFPRFNEPWNREWINIVRKSRSETDWVPSNSSVICSVHFDTKDFYATKMGRRRMITNAIPTKLLFKTSKEKKEEQELEICSSPQENPLNIEPVFVNIQESLETISANSITSSNLHTPLKPVEVQIIEPSLTITPPSSPGPASLNQISSNDHFKFELMKKQMLITKHKNKIKILNQKVRRLHNRNKSLIDVIKILKSKFFRDSKTGD